ncbi:DUF938 domain-containing protein [Altererythrobacter marinus]|uniref:DUF938 domain-containing protein n=1 Tax=Pelagerythrobacter marinus TaxID=538382 RepID=A0ABW9UVU7_9SPHN|nr:DUF938 domain-containing protein [Pelagerythrobacter marinus]MXO67715.1 DUF938 domain-containing protein [Pelagerythrobacter marinus]
MKRHAPAAARNSGPIADVLAQELPESGTVLEIASGSGEHALFFAERFPGLAWQPSDPDPDALASIAAWRDEQGPANLRPPLPLDARKPNAWPVTRADALLCINMVHIGEWEATVGLFRGCAKFLAGQAPIILYGPYLEDDVETAPSNLAFDRSLKDRNPAWGLRKVADVDSVAAEFDYERANRYEMPVNNLTLVYRRNSANGL